MAALTIVGAGGHGKDVAAIARAAYPLIPVIMLDDNPELGHMPTSMQIMAEWYLLGFNSPDMREEFDRQDHASYALHPWANVDYETRISPGVVVGALTAIGPGVKLGRHVHVAPKVSLVRATVGDYTTISPGADICGDVEIGRRCHIGAGAVICNLVTLKDDVTVGAGAVVLPNTVVRSGETVVGVPAHATHAIH